jgi:hypothetical protein
MTLICSLRAIVTNEVCAPLLGWAVIVSLLVTAAFSRHRLDANIENGR